jgi:hypothetical protein
VTRPPTPLEMSEQQALVRIAMLASDVLRVLRLPERGRYSSERELRQWLVESGVAYTTSDLAPAVGLLELTGRIERGRFSKATSSRAGWLPVHVACSSGVRNGS